MAKKKGAKAAAAAGLVVLPKPTMIPPENLTLDPRNPRLTDEERKQPKEVMRFMIEQWDVKEIAESIIVSGFLPFDPIIGAKENGKTIILEGNRRVAAIKLLRDPSLAPGDHEEEWQELHDELDDDAKTALDEIPVVVVDSRADPNVQTYIGFRHVTGPAPWPAQQKASYIAELIEKHKWGYDQIGERLGHRSGTVERHYVTHRVIEQAKAAALPGSENMKKKFGFLIRALQAGGVSEFLGIDYPNDPAKSKKPVPAGKSEAFAFFVAKTFGIGGPREAEPFVPESRYLTQWGQILRSERATRYVRDTPNAEFDRAWRMSEGPTKSVSTALFSAATRLEEASDGLVRADAEDLAPIEEAVEACAKPFANIVKKFPAAARKHGLVLGR